MKPQLFFLFFSILSINLHAQLIDNFADGNFSSDPQWVGNAERFVVNAKGELQLNNLAPIANNTSYLATNAPTSFNDSTTWECYVRMEFAASTVNFARIYLTANQADLSANINGYFLKIGGATDSVDAVELFRQDGAKSTLLLSGAAGAVGGDSIVVRVRVTRSKTGTWTLLADYEGGTNFKLEKSATDTTYAVGNYVGVFCRYSSTRNKAFFFDDFLVNPLFMDKTPPVLQSVMATSAEQLEVIYNEPLDVTTASNTANYTIDKNIGNPVAAVLTGSNTVLLTLNNALESAVNYTLVATGVADLSGNRSAAQSKNFVFYDVQPIAPGDLILNEILFDPQGDGSDFIELYNNSDKTLNLNGLQIINARKTGSTMSRTITTDVLLLPKAYLAICEHPEDLRNRYTPPADASILDNALPSFDDDKGNVTLRFNGITIDSFDYLDDYHFALLADKEGVSLERIRFLSPTQGANNWQSAAASVKFATPGYQNSQFIESNTTTNNVISIANKTFSPDGDGVEDVLLLDYNAGQAGLTANIRIFDANGRLVKKLVQNELLAARGNFKWDGTNEEGSKARMGIYVVWAEWFTLGGKVERSKEVCVLAGKLD